jgi:hypothetical protein
VPSPHRLPAPLARTLLAAALGALALTASGCANTIQDEAVQPSFLEPLVMQDEFPVYWLGSSFRGLPLINVARDPSGAYWLQYGNCTQGGENVCVTPLEMVTSPDNGFLPGGSIARRAISLRGVRGEAIRGGATIELPTGPVVVDIYADGSALARAAAAAMVTINALQTPGARLARALPATGFAQKPLTFQQPPLAPLQPSASLR